MPHRPGPVVQARVSSGLPVPSVRIGRRGPLGKRFLRSLTDPPEPWEIPVSEREATRVIQMLRERPFRPTKPRDVPEAAQAAIEAACGSVTLDHLLVLPRTTRLIDSRHCVVTPTRVLAFAGAVVALWIDDGPEGRIQVVEADRLLAVDDRQILLYGRLRLIAAETQLVIRYNSVAHETVRADLCTLRCRIAAAAVPTEPSFLWLGRSGSQGAAADLPYKWAFVLSSPTFSSDPLEAAMVAAGDVGEADGTRSRRPATGLALLSPHELVIATEPHEYLDGGRYGVDLLAVPRDRLRGLEWDGRRLTVHLGFEGPAAVSDAVASEPASPTLSLPLDGCLIEAMRGLFGSAVPWR